MRYRYFFAMFSILMLLGAAAYAMGRRRPDALETALETGDLLRLHVVANSDTQSDQQAKLRVRDEVLKTFDEALKSCQSAQEAQAYVAAHQQQILEAAVRAGWTGQVRIQIGPDVFPDRTYNGTLVPAGTYQALKIILGQGAGQNWWCVLYPPLCFGSPTDAGPVKLQSALLQWLRAMTEQTQEGLLWKNVSAESKSW